MTMPTILRESGLSIMAYIQTIIVRCTYMVGIKAPKLFLR